MDTCRKAAEVGNCQNYEARWYYDTKQARCRQFYYGGCGGNDNNFISEDDCLNRCTQNVTNFIERLQLPAPNTLVGKMRENYNVIASFGDTVLLQCSTPEYSSSKITWVHNSQKVSI